MAFFLSWSAPAVEAVKRYIVLHFETGTNTCIDKYCNLP